MPSGSVGGHGRTILRAVPSARPVPGRSGQPVPGPSARPVPERGDSHGPAREAAGEPDVEPGAEELDGHPALKGSRPRRLEPGLRIGEVVRRRPVATAGRFSRRSGEGPAAARLFSLFRTGSSRLTDAGC
ncbi:hypothetical protein ABB07_34035 [Streptomyces incarnatus]|uniref:Uncharacterized protein n=1 Tax=Streptomyces incarnatus TaxID=665007 RepID=A0ABM5TV36_9ACTN|nr:hypothetical protein ABB07_34035 [Streptomyces incarnatus]